MRHRILILLLPALMGCGSPPAPSAPAPAEPAAKSEAPPAPPKIPDAASPSQPKPAAAPAPKETADSKPAPAPAAPAASETTAPKKSGKPDEFDPEIVGGKPIGTYVKQLDSANKDDVIEALNALKFIPKKAAKYLPKITELTKNKDKDIAQEATDAIKTISGK